MLVFLFLWTLLVNNSFTYNLLSDKFYFHFMIFSFFLIYYLSYYYTCHLFCCLIIKFIQNLYMSDYNFFHFHFFKKIFFFTMEYPCITHVILLSYFKYVILLNLLLCRGLSSASVQAELQQISTRYHPLWWRLSSPHRGIPQNAL